MSGKNMSGVIGGNMSGVTQGRMSGVIPTPTPERETTREEYAWNIRCGYHVLATTPQEISDRQRAIEDSER